MTDRGHTRWAGLERTLSGKWTLRLLSELSEGPRGFGQLERTLDGISSKTLSRRLTELRCRGVIDRRVRPTSPPTTRYELTPAGETFVTGLSALAAQTDSVACGCCAEECTVTTVDPERSRQVAAECC